MELLESKLIYIIDDDDFCRAVKKGKYPSLYNDVKLKNISYIPFSDYLNNSDEYQKCITDAPKNDGRDIYMRNQYKDCYVKISEKKDDNENLKNALIYDRAIWLREIFIMMGAKVIQVVEENSTITETEEGGGIRGSNGVIGVESELNFKANSTINIGATLCHKDFNNTPKSIDEIKATISKKGFLNDSDINPLLDRLERDKKLSGTMTSEYHFYCELNKALDIAAGVNFKGVGINLDFSMAKSSTQEFSRKIMLDFG